MLTSYEIGRIQALASADDETCKECLRNLRGAHDVLYANGYMRYSTPCLLKRLLSIARGGHEETGIVFIMPRIRELTRAIPYET